MKITKKDKHFIIALDGAIGESTPLFTTPISDATEITLDMKDVTYINSVGVKEWIIWTNRIPKTVTAKMTNCPFVIANQASMVVGFVTPNLRIESFKAPYLCNGCGTEEQVLFTRGKEFEYAKPPEHRQINIPENRPCPKCRKSDMEPDFIPEKVFNFLG
jgi:hypothetical protein